MPSPGAEDRKLIMGMESETDHLPVGEVRKLWASYSLKKKDVEIARAKELSRTHFLQTCRKIVNRIAQVNKCNGNLSSTTTANNPVIAM
jgi:hypothetical protein